MKYQNLLFAAAFIASLLWLSHSTSAQIGSVDPNFNAVVDTASFAEKRIDQLVVLPDGKIMVGGRFNQYNGQPVGSLVRLNPDGSLDTSFNSNLFAANTNIGPILVQPDGKLILRAETRTPCRESMQTAILIQPLPIKLKAVF